ncbi:hypothetical protein BDZ94DRAFT_1272525 [Collybia nuda]|uniref:Uncharacterized protein n=1 Tax=Collybia nuda TaxID=64659 RepID=A0A9P5XY35_9AGAR|nr:hypothetical protein BDZ94DRAFT_1272525 [Collybia nuda]
MESVSNTAILIVILIVIAILIVLFFTRLRQLGKASEAEEEKAEPEIVPSSPRSAESTSSSFQSPAEIMSASVIVLARERASILPESPRQQSIADGGPTDSTPLPSPRATQAAHRPTIVLTRSDIEMIERSPRQSRSHQPVTPTNHAPPLSPKYPDSMYTTATLPSYSGTAQSRSPPAYSDISRTQSRMTSSQASPCITDGEGVFDDAVPDKNLRAPLGTILFVRLSLYWSPLLFRQQGGRIEDYLGPGPAVAAQ